MKKILFLEQFPNIGGGQMVLLDILKGLDKSKYSAVVALPKEGEFSKKLQSIGVHFKVLPIGSYTAGKKSPIDIIKYFVLSFVLFFKVRSLIKKEKFDLVYANAPRTFLWGTLAGCSCKVPVIWHLHSVLTGIEKKISKILFARCVTKMLAVSKSVAEPFGTSNKISIVYNGVDLARFNIAGDPNKFRSDLGVSPGTKVVAFIGQLVPWKGVENFVRAAAIVLKNRKDTVFVVMGQVLFGGNETFKNDLINIAKEKGVGDKIIFLNNPKDYAKTLKEIDVLVIPSIKPDPCPWIMLAGMAAGKPIIAAGHGGPAEVIENGQDGILYPPADIDELSAYIIKLLNSNDLLAKLGSAAKKKAEDKFDNSKYLRSVYLNIDQVIGHK